MRLRAPIPAENQVMSRTGVRRYRSALLVEVRTDEGITGIGSCSGNGAIIEVIIERILKPILIGMDPTKIEELWDKSYFGVGVGAFGSRGVGVVALSGIDIALWDILGKARDLPLYKLLGGASREKVQVYATALYPEEPRAAVKRAVGLAKEGFHGVKIKVGFDLVKDIERVRAVRAELGDDFAIMTDANMGYDLETARKAVGGFTDCGVGWLEEPLFVEDVNGHALLRANSKIPIALGENLHTRYAFQQFIGRNAVDILQPDVARAGGVSEVKKIATVAAEQSLPISLHTWGDAVSLAASLHLAAALKNSEIMEFDCTYNPLRTELVQEPLEIKNGFMTPPKGAGLGIDIDPRVLRKYVFNGVEEISFRQRALNAV